VATTASAVTTIATSRLRATAQRTTRDANYAAGDLWGNAADVDAAEGLLATWRRQPATGHRAGPEQAFAQLAPTAGGVREDSRAGPAGRR
jgi:hypothetical protein